MGVPSVGEALRVVDHLQEALGLPKEKKEALLKKVMSDLPTMRKLADLIDPQHAKAIRLTRASIQRRKSLKDDPVSWVPPVTYPGVIQVLRNPPALQEEEEITQTVKSVIGE